MEKEGVGGLTMEGWNRRVYGCERDKIGLRYMHPPATKQDDEMNIESTASQKNRVVMTLFCKINLMRV